MLRRSLLIPALTLMAAGLAATAVLISRENAREMDVREEEATITLLAVGDIMPARGVARAMERHEPDWLFSRVADDIRNADIAFANLEAPIVEGPPVPDGDLLLRADPGFEDRLADAGFDVVSVANNHFADFGTRGTEATIDALGKAGVDAVGVTPSRPVVVERGGITVAFLAYVDPTLLRDKERAVAPGPVLMDAKTLPDDIAAAQALAHVVIVSMHAGDEFAPGPNAAQTGFAHAAIDAGADIVIGHHAHVVQPIESYRGRKIIYGLGNFVFDQIHLPAAMKGLAAEIIITKDGVQEVLTREVTITPDGQPSFATPAK